MPSPGNSAIKFLRSNLRRGAKPKVRIAVLGQASVGKTALIVRYCTRRFIVDYSPEVSKIYSHQATLDHEEVAMDIWDTAGHFQLSLSEAELRHLEVFVRWADVLVLVYSVTDRASFGLALQLLEQIRPRQHQQQQQEQQQQQQQQPQRGKSLDNCKDLALPPSGMGMAAGGNNRMMAAMETPSRPGFEPCENCPDLPILLVGTKSDLWRERQVRQESARAAARRFSCAHFKEVSTRESAEEVAEVFELSCRQGWLFRQHRELTKHRSMSIVAQGPGGSAAETGFEKSVSLDCSSSLEWWESPHPCSSSSSSSQQSGLAPDGAVTTDPTSSGCCHVGPATARHRKLSLQPFPHAAMATAAATTTAATATAPPPPPPVIMTTTNDSSGAKRKTSPGSITGILSNIRKCITPAGRPLFHSFPATQAPQSLLSPSLGGGGGGGGGPSVVMSGTSAPCPSPSPSGLSAAEEEERRRLNSEAAMIAATNDGKGHQPQQHYHHQHGGGRRGFFRNRANTDGAAACAARFRSLSFTTAAQGQQLATGSFGKSLDKP